MPKMKTNASTKKRFKKTGTGKIKRFHSLHSHLLTKKDKNRKKRLVKSTLVHSSDTHRVNRMIVKT